MPPTAGSSLKPVKRMPVQKTLPKIARGLRMIVQRVRSMGTWLFRETGATR